MNTKVLLIIAAIILVYIFNAAYFGSKLVNYETESIANLYSPDVPNYYDALKNLDINKFCLTFKYNPFPPFYEISAAVSLLIVGMNWTFMNILNNSIFLLILLVFTFLTGYEIKDRQTGVIALLLVAAHPFIIGIFRSYSLDFAFMSVMVMSIYFLIKSEFFKNRDQSIYFALSCALGMLIKESFSGFIIGPIMIAFFSTCQETYKRNYKALINFTIFCFLFLLLITPYYFYFDGLKNMLASAKREPALLAWYEWESLRLVPLGTFENLLGAPFYLAGIAGLYYLIIGKRSLKIYTLVSIIIVSDIILISIPHFKFLRYLLPQLPALLIICALGLRCLIDRWAGKLALVITITASIFTYIFITYGISTVKIHNIGDWLAKGYTRYYSSDMIQPLAQAKEISAHLADILNSSFPGKVNKIKAMHEPGYIPQLFVLNKTDTLNLEYYFNTFFWFNNIFVKQDIKCLNSIDDINVVYSNRSKIDFILTGVPAGEGSYAGSFDFIKKYLNLDPKKNYNDYEQMWNETLKSFNKRELLCKNSSLEFYLYSK
ncbi:MAG: glycosyltransferase family 39 protein [Elusimicrobia bacterium]|nr:glycosyltransferase family 39 protein [Candidatus Liberimonas magnetica]